MKKWTFLLLTLLVNQQVHSADTSQSFKLIYETASSCTIEVTNNNIEGKELVTGETVSASLTFGCVDLDKAFVLMNSVNGGLQKVDDPKEHVHYEAELDSDAFPYGMVKINTETDGTSEHMTMISNPEGPVVVDASLEVTVLDSDKNSTDAGVYTDKLRIVLRPSPASS